MYCSVNTDNCEVCLLVEGAYCGQTSICHLPPNMTLWLFFLNPFNKEFKKQYTADEDGCIDIEISDLPSGWWGLWNKTQVRASADEDGCSTILFEKDGLTYPCLIYSFVVNPEEVNYTSTLCNSVIKLSGNITGNPDFIQDNTLIGYNSLMVIIDGTQVNNIDNNGNTNWAFNATTGTIQFTYNLQDTPFFILAF
jgi:hypothetical protein